jgi:hypothetical protein
MFGVVGLLLVMGEGPAAAVLSFYGPALNWIAKWLPLFYVASLVTLPLALKGIAGVYGTWACVCMARGRVWVGQRPPGPCPRLSLRLPSGPRPPLPVPSNPSLPSFPYLRAAL